MVICPHCGQEANDPKAARFDSISMGRLTCSHCGREFLVVDDIPMTEGQYRQGPIEPNDRWFWGRDGAGQPVDPVSVTKAVKAWSELWGNALFDCGPQDYEFMAKEIIRTFDLVDELEDRLDLPEVQRRRNEPTIPLADVKKKLDL